MSTLEIRKHQLYFKQTVNSVKSWAWQPHQDYDKEELYKLSIYYCYLHNQYQPSSKLLLT